MRPVRKETSVTKPTVVCDGCRREVPAEGLNNHLPDYGLTLNHVPDMGYYGGFWDNMGFPDSSKYHNDYFIICHDCSVKLLEALPGLGAHLTEMGYGGHASIHWVQTDTDGTKYPPCCKWCWCWKQVGPDDYITYFASADGKSWETKDGAAPVGDSEAVMWWQTNPETQVANEAPTTL